MDKPLISRPIDCGLALSCFTLWLISFGSLFLLKRSGRAEQRSRLRRNGMQRLCEVVKDVVEIATKHVERRL